MVADDHPKYLVIDNFMDAAEMKAVRAYVEQEPFFFDNAFEWKKVWHPLDGQVLVTSPANYGETGRAGDSFPTDTPLDLFFNAMEEHAAAIARVLRCAPGDIKYVVSAYLYRVGWGLSWHNDAGPYTGAFAYYIHEQWRGNWGGELMIIPDERLFEPQPGAVDLGYEQGGGFRDPAFSASGRGEFVMPLSNRLVVMSQALLHSINPVKPQAGENMRFSLAGFFL